jgi:hypothetical protein
LSEEEEDVYKDIEISEPVFSHKFAELRDAYWSI